MSTSRATIFKRLKGVPWEVLGSHLESLLPALDRILSGERAERVLERLLRSHPSSDGPTRQALAEAVFGVALWRRRLEWHAGTGSSSRLLVRSLLESLVGLEPSEVEGIVPARPEDPTSRSDLPTSLGVLWSFPDWMLEIFREAVGSEECEELLSALNLPGPICLRVNGLRTSADALTQSLRDEGVETLPGRFAPGALVVQGDRPNIYGLTSHQRGHFEVQDEGSQLVGLLLDAKPGDNVLDYCAGAGGKTLQLASEMRNEGALYAYDIDGTRLQRLRERALRAGASCVRPLLPRQIPSGLLVDRVLVDAPCSELGALRRGPDARFLLKPETLSEMPVLQGRLLDEAALYVKPGGTLVYATCTLHRAENQGVALAFEGRHPRFERLHPGGGKLDASLIQDGYFTSLPHRHGTDGFFGAVWRATP